MRISQVKAETRAIRATWTRELVADLESYLLKDEIQKERASNRKKSINKIFRN